MTPEQKERVLDLLAQGVSVDQIAKRVGVPKANVIAMKAVKARASNKATRREALGAGDDSLLEEAVAAKFGLERDLQAALRRNIDQLEPGLKIVDGGKERKVESGLIDITAEDQSGTSVVIELKAGEADRDAIGQILAYMGDIAEERKPVRGILVAGAFSTRAIAAARMTPNVRLVQYSFRFSFQGIGKKPE